MSNSKSNKKQGPRGSKADVASVRQNAAAAGRELRDERAESVSQLAQALGEITEGEALAHLDSRLAFIERQVERLNARRDEADRGVQGDLAVMRARIEDALEAVGATAEQQNQALVGLERRLNAIVAEAERGSADVVESLREEIVAKVQETAHRLEKLDARVRGETKAFEEGFDERARTIAQSISETRDALEERFEEAAGELQAQMDETLAGVDKTLARHTAEQSAFREEMEEQLDSARARLVEDLTARATETDARFEAMSRQTQGEIQGAIQGVQEAVAEAKEKSSRAAQRAEEIAARLDLRVDERLAEVDQKASAERAALIERLNLERAQIDEKLSAGRSEVDERFVAEKVLIDERLNEDRARLDEQMAAARAEIEELLTTEHAETLDRLAAERREAEGRLSEWGAEFRMETQRLREAVENRSKTVAEALEVMRRELLSRIQASEEKAATSAVRLQSMIDQQKREIVSDEQEWSGMLQEVGENLAQLKVRVEELVGRVSASEARRASERGSSQAIAEGVAARVEALEQKVREAVEEVVAKQGTRLEMLSSQVAQINEGDVASEERAGAVEYLKRRVGEMAERIDEIMVKVNAIGRYVTKPGAVRPVVADQPLAVDLAQRLGSIEQAMTELAVRDEVAAPAQLLERIAELEGTLTRLGASRQPDPEVERISERLGSLEGAIAELSAAMAERQVTEEAKPFAAGGYVPADLSVRVEPPAQPTATTIIPSKRRRW